MRSARVRRGFSRNLTANLFVVPGHEDERREQDGEDDGQVDGRARVQPAHPDVAEDPLRARVRHQLLVAAGVGQAQAVEARPARHLQRHQLSGQHRISPSLKCIIVNGTRTAAAVPLPVAQLEQFHGPGLGSGGARLKLFVVLGREGVVAHLFGHRVEELAGHQRFGQHLLAVLPQQLGHGDAHGQHGPQQ